MKSKIIFGTAYILLLALGAYSVYVNIPFGHVIFFASTIANILQRLFGLTLFTMLFVQIMLGFFLPRLTEKFGGWLFKFHIFQGLMIYGLVLSHVLSFALSDYFANRGLDPFYIFTDFCLLCSTRREFYITLGRISFWLITTSVLAGLYRTASPFMRVYWKKFHILNYLLFLLIGIHGFFIGTDFTSMPFFAFAIAAYIAILAVIVVKSAHLLKKA